MKSELASTIGRLIKDAQQTEASERRSDLFDRYMGEPYGDEVDGRSKFISTDVADAVEAILPDIMDVFTSAEDILAFSPVGPEDEDASKQETGVVSHVFWEKNRGFENLYTWFKEALIQQNSYIKYGWEEKRRVEIDEYADLGPDELLSVLSTLKGEVEVLEQEGGLDENGQFSAAYLKIRSVSREKRFVIRCIPQEEFFISQQWNSLGLEGVPCCGHKRTMEAGELIAMGFDEDSIEKATAQSQDNQAAERFDTEDVFEHEAETGDKSTRKVVVYEAYCRLDIDDDGESEQVKVWATGDGSTVLRRDGKDAIEEVSHIPFAALTPYIVPHRHVGRAVAELVDDIQKVKTILLRATLDNIYATQYGRPYFDENEAGPNTFTDLVKPEHGAPVRTGGAEVQWYTPPAIVGTTLPLLQGMDDLMERRTGATRYNQGLDSESLNKTASGINQIMNASQKKTKLVARVFAETGLRDLFMGIHRELRKGPWKEIAVKLQGKWVSVNPRVWADRTDMTVKVGMGTGDRDEVRQGIAYIQGVQAQLVAAGSRMPQEQNIFAATEDMAKTYGIKSLEPYLTPPDKLPPATPSQPDPQTMLAQKQMQIMEDESKGRMALDLKKADDAHAQRMEEIRIKAEAEQRQQAKTAADIIDADEQQAFARRKLRVDDDFRRDEMKVDAGVAMAAQQAAPNEQETTGSPRG